MKIPVHYEPCDAHQPGALVMLNRHYANKDVSCYNWKVWLRIRDRWMKDQEVVYGKANLTCAICGKTHLDPFTKDKNKIATIDHVLPVKRMPHLWREPSNFQVACYHCNMKKGCN